MNVNLILYVGSCNTLVCTCLCVFVPVLEQAWPSVLSARKWSLGDTQAFRSPSVSWLSPWWSTHLSSQSQHCRITFSKSTPDKIRLCVCCAFKFLHLQWTIRGTASPLILLTDWTKSRKSEESSGTPWSGQTTYCKWVMERCSPDWQREGRATEGETENAQMSLH